MTSMAPDDPHRAAALHVVITDAIGRPLGKRALARWLEAVAPARARGEVTLAVVSDAEMRRLNRRFARADHATDVLSFPSDATPPRRARATRRGASEPAGIPGRRLAPPSHLGDIVIASGVATRQAREAGHSLDTEQRILALHGLLHLLGYDHDVDDGRMARLERRLRRKGGLEEGLIERGRSR